MPGLDPSSWLYRFDAQEWLAAAETELRLCADAYARRSVRPAVTHARRAAGMALNAILVLRPNDTYGRSYMEHLVAAAADDDAPETIRNAAQALTVSTTLPPTLITLGKPDSRPLDAARAITVWARIRVTALQTPVS